MTDAELFAETQRAARAAMPEVIETVFRLLKSDDPDIRAEAGRMLHTIAVRYGLVLPPGTVLH